MISKVYKVEEIFEDIEGDPDNVLMNIPPEVCEASGIQPGDTITIEVKDKMLVIKKADNGKE